MALENYIYSPVSLVRINYEPYLIPEKFIEVVKKIKFVMDYSQKDTVIEIGDVFRLNSFGEINMFKSLFSVDSVISKEEEIPGNSETISILLKNLNKCGFKMNIKSINEVEWNDINYILMG